MRLTPIRPALLVVFKWSFRLDVGSRADIAGTDVRPLSRLVGIEGPEVFCFFNPSPVPCVSYQRGVAVVP